MELRNRIRLVRLPLDTFRLSGTSRREIHLASRSSDVRSGFYPQALQSKLEIEWTIVSEASDTPFPSIGVKDQQVETERFH